MDHLWKNEMNNVACYEQVAQVKKRLMMKGKRVLLEIN